MPERSISASSVIRQRPRPDSVHAPVSRPSEHCPSRRRVTSSKRSFASLYVVLDGIGSPSSNLGSAQPVIQRFWKFAPYSWKPSSRPPRRSSMQRDTARVPSRNFRSRCHRVADADARLVRSFCTALKPPATPTAARPPGGHAASGRSRPTPRLTATTAAACQRDYEIAWRMPLEWWPDVAAGSGSA